MKITLIKYHGTLIPETDEDSENILKLKEGMSYLFKTSRVRSPERHREFFGCANLVMQSLPEGVDVRNMDEFISYLKLEMIKQSWDKGLMECPSGRINAKGRMVVASISWDKMNEDDFEKWREMAYPIMAKWIGLTAIELLEEYHGQEMHLKR